MSRLLNAVAGRAFSVRRETRQSPSVGLPSPAVGGGGTIAVSPAPGVPPALRDTGAAVIEAIGSLPPTMADIPRAWTTHWLGPGQPVLPGSSYRDQAREKEPRAFQYVPNVNATISPRIGYGLMSFADLRYYAENVPEVAMCHRILFEEIKAFVPSIVGPDGETADIPELAWMTQKPDRRKAWSVWLSRFLKNTEIYDAPTIHFVRDADGQVVALRVIDGSTIFPLIDEYGDQPDPPAPAFTQVIWGRPHRMYTTRDLWYRPRFLRTDAPYGETAIEDNLPPIKLLERMWAYRLAEWTEGNMPEMLIPAPQGWTNEQVLEWERAFNAVMAGNPELRMRVRFVPAGFGTPIPKTTATWNEPEYNTALERVLLGHGIPPSEIGKAPGSGLGGKGYQEQGTGTFYRMAIAPRIDFIETPFTEAIHLAGYTDYRFELRPPEETLDSDKREEKASRMFAGGLARRNESRRIVNLDPIPGQEGEYLVDPGKAAAMNGLAGLFGGGSIPVRREGEIRVEDQSGETPITEQQPEVDPQLALNGAQVQAALEIVRQVNAGELTLDSGFNALQIMFNMTSEQARRLLGQNGHVVSVNDNGNGRKVKVVKRVPLVKSHPRQQQARAGQQMGAVSYFPIIDALAKQHTGAMVCLPLPADVGRKLQEIVAQPGVLPSGSEPTPAEEMHITLAYLGEAKGIALGRSATLAACRAFAASRDWLRGKVGGAGRFNGANNDDKAMTALYASFDCPQLPEFRQALVEALAAAGVTHDQAHGFTPHITLAFVPAGAAVGHFDVPDVDITFDQMALAWAGDWTNVPLGTAVFMPASKGAGAWGPLIELRQREAEYLLKHCGVCLEDDAYFGAPVSRKTLIDFPKQGANESEIVAMSPKGLEPRPALWKPASGEDESLVRWIGGPQYLREEAAYLVDRSLEFYLVPVAYVTEIDGEEGAVLHYVRGRDKARQPAGYAPEWLERAAVLDAITGQVDRHGGNWLTHPDEGRPILIDNGLSFPIEAHDSNSPFVAAMRGKPLSEDVLLSVEVLVGDRALWVDLRDCVGPEAADAALERAKALLQARMIPELAEVTT